VYKRVKVKPCRPRACPQVEELAGRILPSVMVAEPDFGVKPSATSSTAGYVPAQLQQAYGVSALLQSGTNGSGETIAIVDAYNDPNILGDANTFSQAYGLPAFHSPGQSGSGPVLTVASPETAPGKFPLTNPGWDTEISLDVEWAHAIAPNANILLVEAKSASLANLMGAVKYAATQPGVVVVSMSFGGAESSSQTTYDSTFATYGQSVTFVASAGDSGAAQGPEYPSSSPYVLAVGGTTLTLSGGSYGSESTWSGGGGGVSKYEGLPSYQQGFQSYGARTTPDVAYDADPNTGVAIYDSVPYFGMKGWEQVGGTSAGAPQWAALVALADQLRSTGGLGGPLGTAQVQNTLYGLAQSSSYAADFHDITTGNNGYAAGPGYDLATGLGSPQANALLPALAASTAPGTVTVTSLTKPRSGGGTSAPSAVVAPLAVGAAATVTPAGDTGGASVPQSFFMPAAGGPSSGAGANGAAPVTSLQFNAFGSLGATLSGARVDSAFLGGVGLHSASDDLDDLPGDLSE
jgi:subtilase family serine protease